MKARDLSRSRNEKVRELYDHLVEGVKRMLSEGELAEFLKFMARFRRYSPANMALIFAQCRHATRVAGIKTWNSLGRRVKRGEKGIAILAPTVKKITVRETNPQTGEETEREEDRLVGFHVTHVWDVSQTEGKPLPEPPAEKKVPGGEAARFIWDRLLAACPFPVVWGVTDPRAKGEFHPRTGEIRLDPALDEGMKAKVLLHETAHGLACRMNLDGPEYRVNLGAEEAYARGEAIAEGAAFIAGHNFGLNTSGYSFEYVAGWVQDAEKLLDWAEAVQEVARVLIELVESDEDKQVA